jgi:hypothetical protein
MTIGEARPGYELWRPNRAKPASLSMRLAVVALLAGSAGLMLVIAFGGWSALAGGFTWGLISLAYAFVYLLLAWLTWRWSRGALTMAIALGILLLIFSAVGFGSWFARDKEGFAEPILPSPVLGTLLAILMVVQAVLIVVASIAFRQEWHVEEERPIRSPASGAGPTPASAA